MPDGPIVRMPDVPWLRSPSVFDSSLVKAMRMIHEVLGPSPEEEVMGMVGTTDIPGPLKGVVPRAVQNLARRLGMYSRVEQVASQVPAKGVHPNRLWSMLKSGASQEELAYRRVPELLASHGDKPVTAEALAQHLAANPAPWPKVVTRGSSPEREALQAQLDELAALGSDRTPAQEATYERISRRLLHGQTYSGETKFAQYQLPGGEHYREQLLTLPSDLNRAQATHSARIKELTDRRDALRAQMHSGQDVRRDLANTETQIDMAMRATPKDPRAFRGSHWDEENVLVHVRHNERALPTGERGRFLEEVQSDWHQQGKKQGYATPDQDGTAADWLTARGVDVSRLTPRQIEIEAGEAGWRNRGRVVPDAPFKESWPDLALKQQLAELADDPKAEWLGFTGSGTQVNRYGTERLTWAKEGDGWNVRWEPQVGGDAAGVDLGEEAIRRGLIENKSTRITSMDDLERLIGGSDVKAEKAWKRIQSAPTGGSYLPRKEGMETFYDELLPKRLEKLVKPFGGTVERAPLGATAKVLEHPNQRWSVDYGNGQESQYFGTAEAAQRHAASRPQAAPAWIVRLTPEMKAKIKAAGLPLAATVPMGMQPEQMVERTDTPRPVPSHAVEQAPFTRPPIEPVPSHATEPEFQQWYAGHAQRQGLSPNPEGQAYDYRAAQAAGAGPDASGHWPSQFKAQNHPNRVVGGFDTVTGQRVPGTPQATEAELVRLGWDPAFARKVSR